MNILLVDDETLLTRGLTKQLNRLKPHWNVAGQAKNGEIALNLFDESIDIMLTDIRMPDMDGLMLTEKVLQIKPSLIVIILTGYAEFEYAQRAIRYGVNDFLLKPVEYQTIITLFEQWEEKLGGDESVQPLIDKVLHYIDKNYASPTISQKEVADFVNLSTQHFSRMFKQKTGRLFIDYLTELRISEAKEILKESEDIAVYEIGEAVGYFNQQYFSQIFKKMVGLTPSQYRMLKIQTKTSNLPNTLAQNEHL